MPADRVFRKSVVSWWAIVVLVAVFVGYFIALRLVYDAR